MNFLEAPADPPERTPGIAKILFVRPLYGGTFPPADMADTAVKIRTLHEGFDIDAQDGGMPYIDVSRNSLARFACGSNADLVMWTDQDTCIPPAGVAAMARFLLDSGEQVCGGVYYKKHPPFEPVTWLWPPEEPKKIRPYWGIVDEPNPCRVGGLGLGAVLMRIDLLRNMRDKFDDELWFVQNIDPRNGEAMGEDVWFFDRVRDMGIDVWALPDIECAHMAVLPIHRGHFTGYLRVATRDGWFCEHHGFHEDSPGHCPGCEGAQPCETT